MGNPGQLLRELLEDFGLTQTKLAELTKMPFPRVNEIIHGKRGMTIDTALRLARVFKTTPDMWLNYQMSWDLWHAVQESGEKIEKETKPLAQAAKVKSPSPPAARGEGAAEAAPVLSYRGAARSATGDRHPRSGRRTRIRGLKSHTVARKAASHSERRSPRESRS